MFRPTDGADAKANAFVFDTGFLPIDVEFGEADPATVAGLAAKPPEPSEGELESEPSRSVGPPPLTLTSTLVGTSRRVAVINNRTYAEGEQVAAAGETWTLLNVEPRRVLLGGAVGTFELRIAPFTSGRGRP